MIQGPRPLDTPRGREAAGAVQVPCIGTAVAHARTHLCLVTALPRLGGPRRGYLAKPEAEAIQKLPSRRHQCHAAEWVVALIGVQGGQKPPVLFL